jgi:hypothetical protein
MRVLGMGAEAGFSKVLKAGRLKIDRNAILDSPQPSLRDFNHVS